MENKQKIYTTEELQEEFKVLGFGFGLVAVEHKETGEKGSFDFSHSPRIYYGYVKHNKPVKL